MTNVNGDQEETRTGPLSDSEISSLRRIVNDYFYRRRIRKMLKVWIYTIGIVATMMVAVKTLWIEIILRLLK